MNSTSLLYVRTSLQLTLTKQQDRYMPAQIACVGAGPRTRLNQKIQSVCNAGNPKGYFFLSCFGLKTGIDFASFGLESGMVFEESTIVHHCIRRFNSK